MLPRKAHRKADSLCHNESGTMIGQAGPPLRVSLSGGLAISPGQGLRPSREVGTRLAAAISYFEDIAACRGDEDIELP